MLTELLNRVKQVNYVEEYGRVPGQGITMNELDDTEIFNPENKQEVPESEALNNIQLAQEGLPIKVDKIPTVLAQNLFQKNVSVIDSNTNQEVKKEPETFAQILNSVESSVMSQFYEGIGKDLSENKDIPPILRAKLEERLKSQADLDILQVSNLSSEKDVLKEEKKLLNIEKNLEQAKLIFKLLRTTALVGGVAGLLAIGLGPLAGVIGVGAGIAGGGLDFAINPNTRKHSVEAKRKGYEANKKDEEMVKADMILQRNQVQGLGKVGSIYRSIIDSDDPKFTEKFYKGLDLKSINAGLSVS